MSVINRENNDNQSVSGTQPPVGFLSYDYHQTDEYKNELFREHIIFLLHYLITIPIFLFLISRLIRCLRHQGYISRGSEQCMLDECNRRLTHVVTGANRSRCLDCPVFPALVNQSSNSGGESTDDSPPYRSSRRGESIFHLVEDIPRPPRPGGHRFRSLSAGCNLQKNNAAISLA
jgi:hypothetical protein